MQIYYFTSPGHNGQISLMPGLPTEEVAKQIASMWGIDAATVTVSLEEPSEVRSINSLTALEHNYRQSLAFLSAGFDAPTWAAQAEQAKRLLADNKDKFAVKFIEAMLTADELAASKTKIAAAILLAEKIVQKHEAHLNKVAKINGLYRQAQLDLKAEKDADKRNAINEGFLAAIT